MRRSQTVDEHAFGALYDCYVQRVHRYCYYRTNYAPDAEGLFDRATVALLAQQ